MSTGNKLFVGNLAWSIDSGALRNAFSRFGDIVNAVVMHDRETGRSRGFGFITFKEQSHAEAAIKGMDAQSINGREVRVHYADTQGGGGGGPRQGADGGNYRSGGDGGYRNQSYGGGHGGGWGQDQAAYAGMPPQQAYGGGHPQQVYGGHPGQQTWGGGPIGYAGGNGGQGNWRGQPDNYNTTGGGW